MAIHAFVYYPLMAWFVGRKSPRVYIGRGANAIITGLSTNSSLATVPITLRCLDSMIVSPESSRLAALIGTNLNNDGITLYEAMAALFLAQALGYHLPLDAQPSTMLHWEICNEWTPSHCSGKVMICGHTEQRSGWPLVLPHAICIDTFCSGSGWLTCLDIGSGRVWQATQMGATRSGWIDEAGPR